MRLCCALKVFPEEEEKNNKSSGTGQIRFQTAFSLFQSATLDDERRKHTDARFAFRRRIKSGKNDDALKVVALLYLLRNWRGRAVVVALRVLAIVVRRSLFVDHYTSTMSRRIRRRLSDDALCSSRRERERRKGESLPMRFCCRATTKPFGVLLPKAVERKEG